MDFRLNAQQDLFKRTVREFAEKQIAPRSREIDQKAQGIPSEIIRAMADLGLFGVTIPEEYGGSAVRGEEIMYGMLAVHEIARAELSMSLPVYLLLALGWGYLIARHGSAELKREVLPRVANGEWFLGIATTESRGGSDLGNIRTRGIRDGDAYVLNGEKYFVSGVVEAAQRGGGHVTLFRTAPDLGNKGMTFAYIPLDTPGITTSKLTMMGRMGLSTGVIAYENARVPAKYVLGEENRGFYVSMEGFNAARVLVCAACTGGAERALEITSEYTQQRELFGQPLAKFEGISFEIAEDYARLEMLKNQLHKTAWLVDEFGKDARAVSRKEINTNVAICKLTAPALGVEIVKHAMMHHGAMGYTIETPLEMLLRGLMSYVVGAEGGANVMKIIIAREFIGEVAIPYR
ncbi:MAG: acyl-CoA/acyl-ACP dehydrogenase [Chloroflexi bacterium]|nr:acyl-CoA/acyl-ACP dehydrogenase [Chloroflexota bacterium]